MMTMTQSIQSNIITLHDAITDTPIYRAATLHFDEQLDAFSRWINDLAQQTKSYADKLKQLNAEAIYLTNKLNPTTIVGDYLLDPKITGMAATNYGNALKTSLTFKLKTVSDLEGNFTQPIQQFADQHIRDFKDFRDRHKHALKNYEGALARYANFNDDHDSATSAQLDEARKAYIGMSSEHIFRINKLRHELGHFLIQQFSTATTSRKELFDDAQVWNQLDTMLFSWTKWLAENKRTYRSEIKQQQLVQQNLENEYLKSGSCKYGDSEKIKMQHTTYEKSGYLLVKSMKDTSSSYSWTRQWFFLQDGYFGSCKVTNPEIGASIALDYCLPLRSCLAKRMDTSNGRFCFEVTSRQQPCKSHFVLQAENEQDFTEWLTAFISKLTPYTISTNTEDPNKNNRPSSITIGSYDSSNDQSRPSSPALLIAKSKSTTVVTALTDIPVTLSTVSSFNSSGFSSIPNLSSSPSGTMHSLLSRSHSITTAASSSVKITCSIPSSTPLLLREITKGLPQLETTLYEPPGSDKIWGTPRYVVSHDIRDTSVHENQQHTISTSNVNPAWRQSLESLLPQDPHIPKEPTYLDGKNQELQNLFYGVSKNEIVMDVFMASYLKKQALDTVSTDQYSNKTSHISLDSGYYYGGYIYVTQDTLWFYSKISINCIISVVLKLKDIEDIRIDQCSTNLKIDIMDGTDPTFPLVFSLVQDDITTVIKKLRFLVCNAKLDNPMPLDTIQQRIIALSTPTPSLSSTTSTTSTPSTTSTTDSSSLNDSSCSSILPSHNKNTPPGLSSRIDSSSTNITVPNSDIITPTTTNDSTCNKQADLEPIIHLDGLPDHIPKPVEPVTCGCQNHLDRCVTQVELPISAKRLYEMMFSDKFTGPSTDGGVWHSKTKGMAARDLRISIWEWMDSDDAQQQDRQMKRTLKYWMPVSNPIVRIKEAEVVETQTLLKKDDYLYYVVQISTKTETLPFADAFIPSVRYCITYVNDSRCKLTCCMGIQWLKWIMAKMIVTRAALSGMSDSIKVFIPILIDAATTIQTSSDTNRQLKLHLSDDRAIDTKNGRLTTKNTSTSTQNIDSVLKSTTTGKESSNCDRQPDITQSQSQLQSQNQHLISTPTPLCEEFTTSITKKMTAVTLELSSTFKLKTTHLHRLVKNSLWDVSFQKTPTLIKTITGTIWSVDWWTSFTAIMIGCMIYAMVHLLASYGTGLNHSSPIAQNQILAHAVYLRDLDKGFIKNSLRPPYGESKSYWMFLESRQNAQQYQWYGARNYRLAQDYDTTREQLGILRHRIINLFQALNAADTHLLENEYLNWLLDYRQRCRHERKLMQQQTLEYNDSSSHLCDQIISQIETYF